MIRANNEKLPPSKKLIYTVIFATIIIVTVELLASTALIYFYRLNHVISFENSPISTVNFFHKAIKAALQLTESNTPIDHRLDVNPFPFYRTDPILGYRPQPGSYTVTYSKRDGQQWRRLRINVNINVDGTRWTGNLPDPLKPSLFIFGGSFVFGAGVNDEQTFSFLLQQAMRNFNVRLFAAPGYSLNQTFLNFERLKHEISDRDTIIIGYEDALDESNVLAPSWLKRLDKAMTAAGGRVDPKSVPKASLNPEGVVSFSYVQQACSINRAYCEQPDPTKEEMQNVTVALANHIAENTNAKLYLLHFSGVANNPVLDRLSKRFVLISALPSDFDYQIRDDIMGYDLHPGPYWHYAIFKKLKAALGGAAPKPELSAGQ
jgi:hypothetical protein